MKNYTDDEIRQCKKITLKIAGDYLHLSSNAVALGMRNQLLPIGFAVHNEEKDRRFSESWSYHIVPERLIAYKNGTISELNVENIEKGLDRMVDEFVQLRQELLFILSENEGQKS
jgi:hypothetical protein